MIFILEKFYNILHISILVVCFSSKYRYLDTALDTILYSADVCQHFFLRSSTDSLFLEVNPLVLLECDIVNQ